MCESGELQSKPSEYKSLAEKGYKQFLYTHSKASSSSGTKQENGTKAEAELKEDEYAEVTAHLANSSAKQAKRNVAPKTAEPESAEKKAKRDASALRNSALRKNKQVVDKATNALKSAEDDSPKLREKGYPEQMVSFCMTMIENFKPKIAKVQTEYNDEVVKVPRDDASELKSVAMALERSSGELESSLKEWIKSDGAHIKKLIS